MKTGGKFGCTDFVNPEDHAGRPVQDVLIEMTDGGVDFSFECVGIAQTMASFRREAQMNAWMRTPFLDAFHVIKTLTC